LHAKFLAATTSEAERAKILEEIYKSNHAKSNQIIEDALHSDLLEVRHEARILQLRSGKGIDVSNPKAIEDLIFITEKYFKDSQDLNKGHVILKELGALPDHAYLQILEKLSPEAKLKALTAVGGKAAAIIENLLSSASLTERQTILHALTLDLSRSKTEILLKHALSDTHLEVRSQCEDLLHLRLSPTTLSMLEEYKKSSNPEIQKRAEELYKQLKTHLHNAANPIKLLTDKELLEKIAAEVSESPTLKIAIEELRYRDSTTVLQALKSPYPSVRSQIFRNIQGRQDSDLFTLGLLVSREPVDNVKISGLGFLANRSDPVSRGLLFSIARNDASPSIQKTAALMLNSFGKSEAEQISREKIKYLAKLSPEEKLRGEHLQNFEAANNVYHLPEFDSKLSPQELVIKHQAFMESVPSDFRVIDKVTDARSGFKLVHYNNDVNQRKSIISIAGTQTFNDALTDASVGIPQIKSAAYLDSVKKVSQNLISSPDKKISVTGHSLGGGVAQAFAHDVAVELKKVGVKDWDQRIEVVTWNGFGGVDPLKRLGKYDQEIGEKLKATNYFVEGDVVSRIGEHIGEIKKLPGVEKIQQGVISSHITSTIESALQKGELINSTAETRYKSIVAPLMSKSLGWMANMYQDIRFTNNRKEIVQRMIDTRQLWAEQQGYRDLAEVGWLDKEILDIRKNGGSDTKWINQAIDEANKKYEQTLKDKRVAPKL
jgi:hypothetical protein